MKKKILFVDDEPYVLNGLQRMLRAQRSEWEMEFAASGQEALKTLEERPFDVVMTDMRMPGMDGCELLDRVRKLHPRVVRIILSGYSDKDLIYSSVGLTHQFLTKPCDTETLKAAMARACSMRELLRDEFLIKIVSSIKSLPSVPSLYREVVEEVNSEDGSLARVAEIISKDVGMSAKILQLVNSAFFGLPAKVTSINRAVNLLGLETIKTLILSIKIFSQFDRPGLPSLSNLWDHSISTGVIAKNMAAQEKFGQGHADESFMAGLLHDIGKLILIDRLPEKYRVISDLYRSRGCRLWEAEQEVLGTTHAQVGAYLVGIWGLSESLVEAIAFHHCPAKCPDASFGTLSLVHLANSAEHCQRGDRSAGRLDFDYLKKLGISEKYAEKLCSEV